MSIKSILDKLVDEKWLYKLPSAWGLDSPRTMYTTPDISAVISNPFGDTCEDARYSEFRQMLDSFIEFGQMSVSENPYEKPQETILARVGPVEAEFWSVRVTDPQETAGIRCLGAFACKNVFVALTWAFREDIDVGAFGEEVKDAQKRWRDLFGSVTPHSGDSLDDYLTNYYVP